jgi:hypothetical protein
VSVVPSSSAKSVTVETYIKTPSIPQDLLLTSPSTQYLTALSRVSNQQVPSLINFVEMLAILSIAAFAVTALAAPQAPVTGLTRM